MESFALSDKRFNCIKFGLGISDEPDEELKCSLVNSKESRDFTVTTMGGDGGSSS